MVRVPNYSKEPGGTESVTNPTWMDFTFVVNTLAMLMVLTGIPGKDTITPWRKLRWNFDLTSGICEITLI